MSNNYFSISNQEPMLSALHLLSSSWISNLLGFALKKNIFTLIDQGKDTLNSLSEILGINTDLLNRLMHGLCHIGLLNHNGKDTFEVTAVGELFFPGAEKSCFAMAQLWQNEFNSAWSKINDAVDRNMPGFDLVYDQSLFEYLAQNPDRAQLFDKAMRDLGGYLYPRLADEIVLHEGETIADIGGGNGYLLTTILQKYTDNHGILFDKPEVIQRVDSNSLERVTVSGGDFFESVPSADVYILSNIIHDWGDEQSCRILSNIRKQSSGKQRLYLVEMMLDHSEQPHLAVSTDLNMLMLTGGKERRRECFAKLFDRSGYQFVDVKNIGNMTCLIEAIAV